ncbi:serine/threonine-protein kinase 32B-like isoform X2 [Limulus polyphemus]|uniref:Serine/threonine-protein kinase 32B-like isoform X2 n=1 Tax=Limulus polyphemus TaxID=6850 RepID=A0ABM1ST79_LIMPO|nr:serine/threonine-protein kinase 32B-like isoform X2 [Limulus polyphemus]
MGSGQSSSKKASYQLHQEALNKDEVSLEDFQILRAIGKGSFGKVCIVQKKTTGKMYAMKYMSKTQCFKKDAFRYVLKEIEILSTLDHPFIVNLWFTFQDDEDMFMVVDLLLGGDLRYHIQHSGVFNESRVSFYVCEVALALDYLQSKNIIHRDIKPDNILLDDEGHAHVTDFNVATVLKEGRLATTISGTKPYIAPEVFQCGLGKNQGYSYAADWWSLGVCGFEMLRGKLPYEIHSGTPEEEVLQMVESTCLRFPREISKGMAELLKRLLHADPKQRISSLEQMKQHPFLTTIDFTSLYNKKLTPSFIPSKHHLNCDPTFELEEMIIESKPLHKKKKRLSKRNCGKEGTTGSGSGEEMTPLQLRLESIKKDFIVYNREKELKKQAKADDDEYR